MCNCQCEWMLPGIDYHAFISMYVPKWLRFFVNVSMISWDFLLNKLMSLFSSFPALDYMCASIGVYDYICKIFTLFVYIFIYLFPGSFISDTIILWSFPQFCFINILIFLCINMNIFVLGHFFLMSCNIFAILLF